MDCSTSSEMTEPPLAPLEADRKYMPETPTARAGVSESAGNPV